MKAKNNNPATNGEPQSEWMRGQAGVARCYPISTRTVSEWQRLKIIPYYKVGRKCVLFRKRDIDAALAKFQIAAIG